MLRKAVQTAVVLSCLGAAACSPQVGVAPVVTPAPATPSPLLFREGGLTAALSDARREHKPVFVDLWATWCPPCMAMRAWSFDAPEVRALADRFVWVSIDRDGPEGDEVFDRWKLRTLPAVLVLDPATGAPRARWDAPLSGRDLATFLSLAGHTPLSDGAAETLSPTRVLYREDDEGRAARDRAAAVLRGLPASSPLAPFLVGALVGSTRGRHDLEACGRLAEEWIDRLPDTGLVASVALTARGCDLDAAQPDATRAAHQLARARDILVNGRSPVLPFERGYSARTVRDLYLELGNAADADAVARRWWTFVSDEWLRATIAQRASLAAPVEFWFDRDGHFAEAATMMGDIAKESPGNVDALRRWGAALEAAGRLDEGIDAIERGLPGIAPENRLPALWEEAELLDRKGNEEAEAALLEAALRDPQAPRVPHRFVDLQAKAEKRLARLRASHSARK